MILAIISTEKLYFAFKRLFPSLKIIGLLFASSTMVTDAFSQCSVIIGSNIDPLEGCDGFSIQFKDDNLGVNSRIWDFGDGSPTTTAKNPVHTFTTSGSDASYTVRLTVTCASGTSFAEKTVQVFAKPKVEFSSNKTSVCAITDSICLINKSDNSPGNSYTWNFKDGTTSNKYEPCKIYSTPGTYDMSLTVINKEGCIADSTISQFIRVLQIPSIAFNANSYIACLPFYAVFTNITDTAGNDYSNWTWNFGDGSELYFGFEPPVHTYTQTGEYTVTLGNTNSLGCSNYSTQKIVVRPSPVAQFSASSPSCQNENVTISFTGSYNGSPVFDWGFDSPGFMSGSGSGPYSIRWNEAGNKNISLTVKEDECSSSISKKIQINPITKVYLNITADYDTICSNQEVTFVASPINYANYIYYVNSTIVQNSADNKYRGSGFNNKDNIYAAVTDINGCTQIISDTLSLNVIDSPVISISSSSNDTICFGNELSVTASPAGYGLYNFFVGNTLAQSTISRVFNISTLTNNDRIYATTNENDCASNKSNSIITTINNTLPPPQVNCGKTTLTSIEFSWDLVPGADSYEISLNGGPFVSPSSGENGLQHILTGLSSGDADSIRVRAIEKRFCGPGLISDIVGCSTIVCDKITYELQEPKRLVCEDDQVILTISQISPKNSLISWNNSIYGNDSIFQFIASSNRTVGVSVMNNTQTMCPAVDKSYEIAVTGKKGLTLQSSEGPSGVIAGSAITFTALPSDFKKYYFYENNTLVQQGTDNIYVSENPVNGHTMLVTAQNEACIEFASPLKMKVVEPLSIPQVNYIYSTEDSITFAWEPVIGATGYMVSINGESFIIPSSGLTGLTHTVGPLSSGDAATISVMALGDNINYGNSEISQPAIGFAEYCNAFGYSIIEDSLLCKGDSITIRINGLNLSNYDIVWGSLPPSHVKALTLRPYSDTVISVAIRNLDKPFCPRQISYVTIRVINKPEKILLTCSDLNTEICQGNLLSFTATPAGYESYEFYAESNLLSESYTNIYETFGLRPGQGVISARARNQACAGEFSNEIIKFIKPRLRTPQINPGGSTDTTISFVWDSIPGALGYNISINGLPFDTSSSGVSGFSHEVTGLSPGDSAMATVIALGETPCGNSNPSIAIKAYAKKCDGIAFEINPYDSICEGELITLSVADINPVNSSISWNGNPFESVVSLDYVGIKDTIISVSVRNNDADPLLHCPTVTKQFEIAVTNISQIILSETPDDTVCAGGTIIFRLSPEEFESYIFYDGSGSELQNSGSGTYIASNLINNQGFYAKGYVNSCSSLSNTIQTTIIPPNILTLTAPKTGDLCRNELVQFTAGPSGLEKYLFNDGESTILESTSNVASINVNSSSVTVSAFDNFNCLSICNDTLKFNLLSLPLVSITSSDDSVCYSDLVSFTATPVTPLVNYSFYLNNDLFPVQTGANNIYSTDSLQSGNFITVVGKDNAGCESQKIHSYLPILFPYPVSGINSISDGICLGDTITLIASIDNSFIGANYRWSTLETTDSIRVSPPNNTNYFLYFLTAQCPARPDGTWRVINSKEIWVDRQIPPIAYAGENATICILDSAQLIAEGGFNYSWKTDSTLSDTKVSNPIANPSVTTTYIVKVSNNFCYSIDSVTVFIDLCLADLTDPVPQIITPNGDEINDFWVIENVGYFEKNRIEIFNRWGNIVYTLSPYDNSWDGKNNNGVELPAGTYYYIIDLGNGLAPRSGFIIIHR